MPCTADVKIKDEVEIDISVPMPGRSLDFGCLAVIARVDKVQQGIAGAYADVDGATRAVIDRHFGVDSARIQNILSEAENAEQGMAMLSTIFPNLGTSEMLDIALEVYREHNANVQQTLNGLEAMKVVMGRAPGNLNTQQKLQHLSERGDQEAAGVLFRLRGGIKRRLSDQVKDAIDQAVKQGRDDIAEQLLLSHELILKQDALYQKKRREQDKVQE